MRPIWAVPPAVVLLLTFNFVNNAIALVQPQVGSALAWVAYYGFGFAVFYADYHLFFLYLDLLAFSMMSVVFTITWRALSLTRAIQACSLLLLTLVGMVGLAAPSDLFTYVAYSQSIYGIAPWFTNVDLLTVTVSILVLSVIWTPVRQRTHFWRETADE